uniref:Uncharacterized protein n=1 Tax=Pyxicephalus adspersus TaxID=30357 RepID=A0AAV3AJ70_PYXAD|nr:TPA: hypothetical protein GDO54_012643 [Pyxicephalus adspersus]
MEPVKPTTRSVVLQYYQVAVHVSIRVTCQWQMKPAVGPYWLGRIHGPCVAAHFGPPYVKPCLLSLKSTSKFEELAVICHLP